MEYKNKASQAMNALQYDTTDYTSLNKSTDTFSDGSHYGVSVLAFNTATEINSFIALAVQDGVSLNALACTRGAFFLEDDEIKEMVRLCAEQDIDLQMGLSCRAEFDSKSAFRKSHSGLIQARRVDNLDAITHSVEEVFRLETLGVTNVIIYDLGILTLLNQLRIKGFFSGMSFLMSSHNNCANYLIAKLFEEQGANYIVFPPDIKLPMLQMIKKMNLNLIPLVSIDIYGERGGFIRINEAPLIVATSSPVFLKFGASVRTNPYHDLSNKEMLSILKLIRATTSKIKTETDFRQLIGKV